MPGSDSKPVFAISDNVEIANHLFLLFQSIATGVAAVILGRTVFA